MTEQATTTVLPGDPPLTIHWRRSARVRRMSLRVSALDGRITLTLPNRAAARLGHQFLTERAEWLRAAQANLPQACPVALGTVLPIEGVEHQLIGAAIRAARTENDTLLVPFNRPAARAEAYLKLRARHRLDERVAHFAAQLGHSPRRITLRDPRSRWGSCTATGDLMFSWRLIMAPSTVLDYVVAHEVAHLAEMNHSAAFWAVVSRLCPGYAAPRGWLRTQGNALHRFRFSSGATG